MNIAVARYPLEIIVMQRAACPGTTTLLSAFNAGARHRATGILAACGLVLFAGLPQPAEAGYLVTFVESGGGVVATGSGSLDISALSLQPGSALAGVGNMSASSGRFISRDGQFRQYSGAGISTVAFGLGGSAAASAATGNLVGIVDNSGSIGDYLALPVGYVSGTLLSSTTTFSGATFASLGLTVGTYVAAWDRGGAHEDTFTIQIGAATPTHGVPEPGMLGLLGAGFAAATVARRRRG